MVLNYYCQELLRVSGSRFYNYATTIAQGEWKLSLLRLFRAAVDGRACIILSSAKLQLFSETTKHFANFFRSLFYLFTFLPFYLIIYNTQWEHNAWACRVASMIRAASHYPSATGRCVRNPWGNRRGAGTAEDLSGGCRRPDQIGVVSLRHHLEINWRLRESDWVSWNY